MQRSGSILCIRLSMSQKNDADTLSIIFDILTVFLLL